MEKFRQAALVEAELSQCKKRKVGAVVVQKDMILGVGHNTIASGSCEDSQGNTKPEVIHAEINAINNAIGPGDTIYVTHEPCNNCRKAIEEAGINKVVIVEDFMKFDKNKLRYTLIPPLFLKALASVLTYGAKKYKPNNWKSVDDIDRYWDALYRHLEARRAGEYFDSESNLPHTWHALTNIGFILYLDNKTSKNSDDNLYLI